MESGKTKERLQKKLRKKKGLPEKEPENEVDILEMMSQVKSMLKTNPELVNKVSNCLSSLMSNPDIMNQLSSEIEKVSQSQTLTKSSSGVEDDALSKES